MGTYFYFNSEWGNRGAQTSAGGGGGGDGQIYVEEYGLWSFSFSNMFTLASSVHSHGTRSALKG